MGAFKTHRFAIAALLSFIAVLFMYNYQHSAAALNAAELDEASYRSSITNGGNGTSGVFRDTTQAHTFLEIASKYGTDKVTVHSYHHMYSKYLEPMRTKPIKMLEIGLGCDMDYGPGKSYYTWLEYLPNVDLYFIEYDGDCAEKWGTSMTGATIFAGDQSDVEFLEAFMETTGGDFDVIVDDGGHTMVQQLTSFETLFQAIKPGGLYFTEDLQTSYWDSYGGGEHVEKTFVNMVKESLDNMMSKNREKKGAMTEVFSIDCMREVCAFTKQELGLRY